MLSTPGVSNRLLPYGSIITKIFRHFRVPITELLFVDTKRLAEEIITSLGFCKRNGKWVKTSSVKNIDSLVAFEDDRMLNDIYPADQLPNFWLCTIAQVLQPSAEPDFEEHEINTDQPPAREDYIVPEVPLVREDLIQ